MYQVLLEANYSSSSPRSTNARVLNLGHGICLWQQNSGRTLLQNIKHEGKQHDLFKH